MKRVHAGQSITPSVMISTLAAKTQSTGTTIVGCVYVENGRKGVVLAADTRATNGPIVADKVCEKIHRISDNIYCCGAGTAADTEYVTSLISSNLALHAYSTQREPRVIAALTMLKQYLYKYQGHVGAALVLGGVDVTGAHLFTVAPHGSTDKLPYVTMGSGSLAAMAVFETGWRDDLNQAEAMELASRAIEAGIFNDLGSGSNVDVRVIKPDMATEMHLNFKPIINVRAFKERSYKFARGTTAIIKQDVKNLIEKDELTSIEVL